MLFPSIFPDELLFSRVVRYLTLSNTSNRHSIIEIFGRKKVLLHPYIPSELNKIADFFGEKSEDMIVHQTVAPIFFMFMPSHANKLRFYMSAGGQSAAVRESQLPSYGAKSLFLKWCPLCEKNDLMNYGVAYWHCSHQIPGITSCYLHSVKLKYLDLDREPRLCSHFLPGCIPNVVPEMANATETNVAEFGASFLDNIRKGLAYPKIPDIYLDKLRGLGFVTRQGRLRRLAIAKEFFDFAMDYRDNFETIIPKNRDDYIYFTDLCSAQNSHHPFRHLLFCSWLFKNADEMFSLESRSLSDGGFCKHRTKVEDDKRCLALLAKGIPLSQISFISGRSRSYLKRLAIVNNINVTQRPRKITNSERVNILELAWKGKSSKWISSKLGYSEFSVNLVVLSDINLTMYRKRTHHDSMRRRCLIPIKRFMQAHAGCRRKDIIQSNYKEYHWLYRNDRTLIELLLPKPVKPTKRMRTYSVR